MLTSVIKKRASFSIHYFTNCIRHASIAVPEKKFLRVAIIGEPNAGKSTLFNKLVGFQISAVSKKINTTNNVIRGFLTESKTQIEFVDCPGTLTRNRALRHDIHVGVCDMPEKASETSDVVAVIVDTSSFRPKNARLSTSILDILKNSRNKTCILLLNKIDLIKDKSSLMFISTRLTKGIVDGKMSIEKSSSLSYAKKKELNLLDPNEIINETMQQEFITKIIDLNQSTSETLPVEKGFDGFKRVFYISALEDDGLKDLRDYLVQLGTVVEMWPNEENLVTRRRMQSIVEEIIKGQFMDNTDGRAPYLLKLLFKECCFDELECLTIKLVIKCPDVMCLKKIIGTSGSTLNKIIAECRKQIANTFGCDVKLKVSVEAENQ